MSAGSAGADPDTAADLGEDRPTVLVFVPGYLPGFRFGGPIRTVSNLVSRLGDEFRFKIVTADRDYASPHPYEGVSIDAWNPVAQAQVFYASPGMRSFRQLANLIRSTSHDLVYLNGLFNRDFTIKPLLLRRLGALPAKPLILAPRGCLTGTLELKATKKALFLGTARLGDLYRGVLWHAASGVEAADIRARLRVKEPILVAPNLPSAQAMAEAASKRPVKREGELDLVFLSRISPEKNLLAVLAALSDPPGAVKLTVYGPVGDETYWRQCQQAMAALPPRVSVAYRGEIPHENVARCLANHQVFVLPSVGENFGHVILEALGAACPVIVSDRTPWRDLAAARAGRDVALETPALLGDAIGEFLGMDQAAYAQWAKGAKDLWQRTVNDKDTVKANRSLFVTALNA